MANFAGSSSTNFGGATPSGNFVPEIFSQKVLNFFRTMSVVEGITNNDYYGEISAFGDTVRVIREPTIAVTPYLRGDTVTAQALADDELTLILDLANTFAFAVDDIEEKISHINWSTLATGSATYSLKNTFDKEVLLHMSGEALAANIVNADTLDATTASLGFGAGEINPLNQISELGKLLSVQDVPEENRWLVVDPAFMELIQRADSTLLSTDFNQGASGLRNGLVMEGKLRGFSVFMTNNAPTVDTTDGSPVTRPVLMAGHMSSTATASAITKVETLRDTSTFADIVRGLHVYGRQVIRPEAIATVRYLIA